MTDILCLHVKSGLSERETFHKGYFGANARQRKALLESLQPYGNKCCTKDGRNNNPKRLKTVTVNRAHLPQDIRKSL